MAHQYNGAPLASTIEYVRSESTAVIIDETQAVRCADNHGDRWRLRTAVHKEWLVAFNAVTRKQKNLVCSGSNFVPGSKTMRGPVKPSPNCFSSCQCE